jgi:hypothetical protein
MSPVIAIVLVGIGAVVLFMIVPRWLQRRAEFIRTYRWPAGLLERLEKHRPGLERKNSALYPLIRTFLRARLRHLPAPHAGGGAVGTSQEQRGSSSRVVVLLQIRKHRPGPTRVPLLFALDSKLNIPNGGGGCGGGGCGGGGD